MHLSSFSSVPVELHTIVSVTLLIATIKNFLEIQFVINVKCYKKKIVYAMKFNDH